MLHCAIRQSGSQRVVPAAEVLARRKCGILNFTKAAQLEVGQTLLHYLAAAADPNDAVARLGEDLLKKRCGTYLTAFSWRLE